MVPGVQEGFHLCGKVVPPVGFLFFSSLPSDFEQGGIQTNALQEEGGMSVGEGGVCVMVSRILST